MQGCSSAEAARGGGSVQWLLSCTLPSLTQHGTFGRGPASIIWSTSVPSAYQRVSRRTAKVCLLFRYRNRRHEAASQLFEKGLNPMEVATITGHKTLQMLKRYTHLRAEDLVEQLG